MTDAENLRRDIEAKLDSISMVWAQRAPTLAPSEKAEVRRVIELHLDDLKQLMANW